MTTPINSGLTTDPWGGRREYLGPALSAFAVTPNDVESLPSMPKAIYVGVAGNLTVVLRGDTAAVTFANVAAGTTLNIAPRLVHATGTTAGDLLGLI